MKLEAHCNSYQRPPFVILDFFRPNEILKLFCIVKTFTCFPGTDMCVLFTIAVALDGTMVCVIVGVIVLTPGNVVSLGTGVGGTGGGLTVEG